MKSESEIRRRYRNYKKNKRFARKNNQKHSIKYIKNALRELRWVLDEDSEK